MIDAGEMRENFAALDAELLVTSTDTEGDFAYDHVYLRHFIDATGPPLIYDNGRYAVYLIRLHQKQDPMRLPHQLRQLAATILTNRL